MVRKKKSEKFGLQLDFIGNLFTAFAVLYLLYITSPVFEDGYNSAGDHYWHSTVSHFYARLLDDTGSFFGFFDILQTGQPLPYLYQPLYYFIVVFIHKLTFMSVFLSEKTLLALNLALYPLAIHYLMIRLGFNRVTAGLAALFSTVSNAGWANNLTAYYMLGIVTQSMGMILFPIIIALFLDAMKSDKHTLLLPVLFTLSMMAHFLVNFMLWNCINLLFVLLLMQSNNKLRSFMLKKYVIIFVLMLLISSFWLIPFQSLIHQRSTEVLSRMGQFLSGYQRFSFTIVGVIEDYVSGRIFDVNDGTLNKYNFYMNGGMDRLPLLTLFSLIGLLFASVRMKHIGYAFLSIGFFVSMLFVAGSDDVSLIGIVPFQGQMYFMRVLCVFEFFTVTLAGVGLYELVALISNTAIRLKNLKKRETQIFMVLLLAVSIPVFHNMMYERYQVSKKLIQTEYYDEGAQIDQMFKQVDISDMGRIYVGHETDIYQNEKQPVITMLSGLPTIMTPNWEQYYTQQVLWRIVIQDSNQIKIKNGIPYKPHLMNLYNIKYLVSAPSWSKSEKFNLVGDEIRLISQTNRFELFEVVENFTYFGFLERKPVQLVGSQDTWMMIGLNWILGYQSAKNPQNMPFVTLAKTETLDDLDLDASKYPLILAFDYEIKDPKLVREKIQRYLQEGGEIASLDLSSNGSKYLKVNNEAWFDVYLPETEKFKGKARLMNQVIGNQYYSIEYEADEERYLIFKFSFFPGWYAYLDGKQIPVETLTPGFVGMWVPEGTHKIEMRYYGGIGYMYPLFLLGAALTFYLSKRFKILTPPSKVEKQIRFNKKIFQALFIILIIYLSYLYAMQKTYNAPNIGSPNFGDPYLQFHIPFKWALPRDGNFTYEMQISGSWAWITSSAFEKNIVKTFNLSKPEIYMEEGALKPEMTYYWRVRVIEGGEAGSWSQIARFKTLKNTPNIGKVQPVPTTSY